MKNLKPIQSVIALLVGCLGLAMVSMPVQAATLSASYNDGTEVPATSAGYTASGNTVSFALNYAPEAGTSLMVVNNTALDPIAGEFDNLANGQEVDLSFGGKTYSFVAWYYGGRGSNDLVLLWRDVALAAWGSNSRGQLGDNTLSNRNQPTAVDRSGVLAGKTVVAVFGGSGHSLALCSDGTLAAWGSNYIGQLGDNTTTARHVPTAVDQTGALAGKSVIGIVAGFDHNVALCSDGTLASWGSNINGQIGDNSSTHRHVPVLVDQSGVLAGKTVVAISAGQYHNLALCSDGSLAAWGGNFSGQLGDGSTTTRRAPVWVDQTGVLADKTIVAIAAGNRHSLALCSDGTLASWGNNEDGQLGNDIHFRSLLPVLVDQTGVLSGKTVDAIAAAGSHSIALCLDGTLAAWGRNSSGQLGIGYRVDQEVPVLVDRSGVLSGRNVTGIAAGEAHSLVLCSDGTAAAWGENYDGRLGDDTTDQSNIPVSVDRSDALAGKPFALLAGGNRHSMAIYASSPDIAVEQPPGRNLTDGSASINFGGTAPGGGGVERTFTVRNADLGTLTGLSVSISGADAGDFVVSSQPAPTIAAATTTTFSIRFAPTGPGVKTASLHLASNDVDENPFDITVYGTGSSNLVAAYSAATDVPLTTANFSATGSTVELSLNYSPAPGTNLTVVESTGGGFIDGEFDNLPNGAAVDLDYDGATYQFVAYYYAGEGNNDLVLLSRNVGLATSGWNGDGQLGDGSTTQREVPVAVERSGVLADRTVVALSAGGGHNLALCADGALVAWGRNDYGQLGDHSTVDRQLPVLVDQGGVLNGKTVVAIAAGGSHSLALCTDGTLAAWGWNRDGQIGDDTNANRHAPVLVNQSGVLLGKKVIAISAGGSYNLALCSDGTIASWGWNQFGQLGDGSTSSRNAPVTVDQSGVLSGKTIVEFHAGHFHALALCSDGCLVSWGSNSNGQLGDGSTSNGTLPVLVDQGGVLSGRSIEEVAAGSFHSVVRCSDGTLAAWGLNSNGQLGDGSNIDRHVPVLVDQGGVLSGKVVTGVACGGQHSLALFDDGTLAAWGSNLSGQLGDASTTSRSVPVNVQRGGAYAVSAGSTHTLALYYAVPEIVIEQPLGAPLTDGVSQVDFGVIVLGSSGNERTFTVRNSDLGPLTDLSIGISGPDSAEVSVVSDPARHVTFGDSTAFTIRFSATTPGAKTASLHISSNDADESPFDIDIVATASTTLDATFPNTLYVPMSTDGFAASGNRVELALGFAPRRGTNLTLVNNTGHLPIDGEFDNLANGEKVDLRYNGRTYPFIAYYHGGAGHNDLVLLWRDAGIAAWGSNSSGQLGVDSENRLIPATVDRTGVLAGKTVVAMAAGGAHNLALCVDGSLVAWGSNSHGQLGDASTSDQPFPVMVDRSGVLLGKTIVAIAAGSQHSLALCSDGTIAAWGKNQYGELGDSTNADSPVPVAANQGGVLSAKTVIDIEAGGASSFALCSEGRLAAWGRNHLGQLGDGTTTDRNVPVALDQSGVLSGRQVVSVEVGARHSMALCADGSLAAWGYNRDGQLGDGTRDGHTVPVAVDQGGVLRYRSVIAIAAGGDHSLALCSDGTLAAWGANSLGQLGDDSTVFYRATPVRIERKGVLRFKSVVGIAAGEDHSVALCSDGTLAAWGANFSGQIGDNSTLKRAASVAVNRGGVLRFDASQAVAAGFAHTLAMYAEVPQIAVEGPSGTELTSGGTVHFPAGVLVGDPQDQAFVVSNRGFADLADLEIGISGEDAAEFSVVLHPDTPLVTDSSTSFVVRFSPTGLDTKRAILHIRSNDPDDDPFELLLIGNTRPGAHLRAGESLLLDLSWVPLALGERIGVFGLPPGLVFDDGPPPAITGTVLGLGSSQLVSIRIFNGNRVVQTIPLELSVEPARATSSYELLLEEDGMPVGKLRVTIDDLSRRSIDPTYTATLERVGETRLRAKGSFTASDFPQTVPVEFSAGRNQSALRFDLVIAEGSDLVTAATNPLSTVTGRGFRLMRSGRTPTGNPALTLTLPPTTAGDRDTTPAGIGYANGKVTSRALVPLRGQLGDAQAFSTSLSLSHTDQAVVWLTPYKNRQSYLGGIIEIGDFASANRTASADRAGNGLQWKREADAREKSYPGGFGPLTLDASTSRWVPVRKAYALAQSLGLYDRAIDVGFIAPTADVLPDQLSLRDNWGLLPLSPEDSVVFKGRATVRTGLFAGTLGLAAPANRSAVKGVFLQEESFGMLVGQGLVKVPIDGPVRGSFQTAGIELHQTAGPGTYSYRLGDEVNIDLSFLTLAPGETIKVLGLPKGLTFTSEPTPMITGTALGYASTKGVQVQILNGRTVVKTLALDLAIEPYAFAGEVEVLLEEAGLPVGKLRVKIGNPSVKSPNPSYSATLERRGERRRVARGSFAATDSPQTVEVVFPALRTLAAARFELILTEGSDLVTGATNPASAVTARGFRLAKASRVPQGNPTLTLAFPADAASDGITTPAGTGHAIGKVTSRGVASVRGLLGDAQKFSSKLSLSQTNQAVVWITPYKNKQSYLGGITELGDVGAADRGASAEVGAAGLKWKVEADPKAKAYADGFGPLDLETLSSRWYPQRKADALAQSLGLNFQAINVDYQAPTGDSLPTIISLRNNSALLPLAPDDSVAFKGKAVGKTGTFNGRLRLPAPATSSSMNGVFLQDEAHGRLIGLGLIKVPVDVPVRGSYRTSGVVLSN